MTTNANPELFDRSDGLVDKNVKEKHRIGSAEQLS